MKYKAQIVPTENGWIVTQIQSPGVIQQWEAASVCAGKDWSFETIDSLLKALPGILNPTEQPKPPESKWQAGANETPLPATPAIYLP